MIRTLKTLIGVHQRGDATAAEIEAALAGTRAEVEAARIAHAEADAAYTAGLLRLDEGELQQLVADKSAAAIRRDRAGALVDALARRLDQARAAEDQAARRRAYEAAGRAQVAAAKLLAAEYPKLARALVDVLRTVAEADALARAANEALPDAAERLPSVEARVRREPDAPERVTASEDFTAWCRPGGERLHPDDQASVQANLDGHTGTWKPLGGEPVPVVLRRFRRVTRVPETPGRDVPPLAATLNLPGLRATHAPFWTAGAARDPAGIVAAIAAAAQGWGKSAGPAVVFDPLPVVDVVALDGPADVAA